MWCAAGFASDLPDPGDVVPVNLAGWQLILLRDQNGDVAAFHNICRHRGMRLIDEPCHRLDGIVLPVARLALWSRWNAHAHSEARG